MPFYYQLVKPLNGIDEIYQKAKILNLDPARLDTTIGKNALALKITPENINKFDYITKDMKIKFLLVPNISFENLIELLDHLNVRIRNIETEELESNLEEEIQTYIVQNNIKDLLITVKKHLIIIKMIEFSLEKIVVKIYESGILWLLSGDLSSDKDIRIIEPILKTII
jgi:hypothetical protein